MLMLLLLDGHDSATSPNSFPLDTSVVGDNDTGGGSVTYGRRWRARGPGHAIRQFVVRERRGMGTRVVAFAIMIAAFVQPAALFRLVAAAAALLTLPCSPIPNTKFFAFIGRRRAVVVVEPRRRITCIVFLHAKDIDRRLKSLDDRSNVKGHPPAREGADQKDDNDDAMSLVPFRTRKTIHDIPS
jgi:hypothetical protein